MSRSYKKAPITSVTTAASEKQDKRLANRLERRKNKQILQTTEDEAFLLKKREVSNVWSMDKDGKIRFDPLKNAKLLRK